VVARDLGARNLPAIYRVHGAPKEEKVQVFVDVARSLGFKLDKDAAQRPDKLAHFLRDDSGTVHTQVLSYLLLRAMQQATYSTDNIGHFGLAAPDYVHFTSPIRRYPDLAVHRLVRIIARREKLRGKKLKEMLSEQATESSRLERRAMAVEREVVDLYRAMLMRDRLGDTFDATVTGITEHGIFAAIEKPFVDVFCRVGALPADQYQIDPYGIRLSGTRSGFTVTLFDPITVRIEEVSVARRRISAVLAASPLDTSGEPKRALRVTAEKRRPSRAPRKPKRAQKDRNARKAAGRSGLVR
jgi:ribonuclease R